MGSDGNDVLTGTAGDDSLYGRGGDDRLDGLGGNDDLDGGRGRDELRGGPGNDAASYGAVDHAVDVSLDGKRNDGALGEGDELGVDVESVYGGSRDDTLTGNGGENTLDGADGNDTIEGGGGFDGLYGGPGDDVIDAKDGKADAVDCGAGADTVNADALDIVRGCEKRGTGKALPSVKATGTIVNTWRFGKAHTIVTMLNVVDVSPIPATVEVRCNGQDCAFGRRAVTVTGSSSGANFTLDFKARRLRIGTVIEVRIMAPQALGKYIGYKVRKRKLPSKRRACLVPGSAVPIHCP